MIDKDVELIRVSTDNYDVLYMNGKIIFLEHRLDLTKVLRALFGYRVIGFIDYYIDSNVLKEKYDENFPIEFDEFDLDDLTT